MKTNFFVHAIALCALLQPLYGQKESVTLNPLPSRVLGHPNKDLVTASPNWVEGRELTTPQGIALDTSATSSAGILYVADTGNNRVLAWKNAVNANSGAPADLVIGQRDRFKSDANGPGTNFTTGLNQPTGVVVDSKGNLYVVDTNNNRILRYPRPFDQPTDQLLEIDVMLGQETFGSQTGGNTGRLVNRGRSTPAANSLYLSDLNSNIFRIRLAFDAGGNLWVADSGNNRVLRYPARVLEPGNFGPDADVALGQLSLQASVPNSDPREKSSLFVPSGIAIAADARLYVSDARGRVLVYRNPTATGQSADRILGVLVLTQGQPIPPAINDTSLGSPEAIFVVNNQPLVLDARYHRMVRYDLPDAWPSEAVSFSPKMKDVSGQGDFNSGDPNRSLRVPGPSGYNLPVDAVPSGSNLFLVDANNHRVLMIPGGAPFTAPATKVFGQTGLDLNGANLVEGKEFFFAGVFQGKSYRGGGIALDGNILYVADTLNHRVLGFRDVRNITLGKPADIVIGQVSMDRTTINSPDGNQNIPNQTGVFLPHAVAVDSKGDLYIADTGNSRVLRYPRPFDNVSSQRPNLVLGQSSFTGKITDASPRNMSAPVGLAFTVGGSLLVSDNSHNRVLYFQKPTGGDFTNGQAAANVIGQPDFITTTASNDAKRMNAPRGVTLDVDDRMYVVDAGNQRMMIYNRVTQAGSDASPALTLAGISSPQGITADPNTAEIWITDGGNGRSLRFPSYEFLSVNSQPNLAVFSQIYPLDLKTDQNSNLVISDAANRIAFFYQAQSSINAANQQTTNLTAGMIATMYARGGKFADSEAVAPGIPWPKEMADTQVLFDDQPVPLYYVGPKQINFQVPWSAQSGKNADITVIKKSTGQVLASSLSVIDIVSPGFFTATSTGGGQISAINEDGTVNSTSNPVARSKVISLYGTGLGAVSNTPADGAAAGTPLSVGVEKPDVYLNGIIVPAANVLYSGLAPGFVGLWQLNVKIPDTVAPGNAVSVIVQLRSVPSQKLKGTVIAVKQ